MRVNSVVKYRAIRVLTTAERFEVLRGAMEWEERKLRAHNKNAA